MTTSTDPFLLGPRAPYTTLDRMRALTFCLVLYIPLPVWVVFGNIFQLPARRLLGIMFLPLFIINAILSSLFGPVLGPCASAGLLTFLLTGALRSFFEWHEQPVTASLAQTIIDAGARDSRNNVQVQLPSPRSV